jgi:hypothetical protein
MADDGGSLEDRITAALRKGPRTLAELAGELRSTAGQALDALHLLQSRGLSVHAFGDKWSLEKTPVQSTAAGRSFEYQSRPDHTFVFGAIGDSHLCSKQQRLDVLDDLYDRFARAGVDRVFHAGNWIDGEAIFNRYELLVHGMEEQIRYLVHHYPQRPGLNTYAIAGEDHEGWYCRRENVDVGRFAERIMRESGREDWHDLGFIEAKIDLVNATSGQRSSLLVMHPGGGSSYAVSYRPQKIVESFDGGEKPAVALIGHYHKLSVNMVRNVWALQVGTQQDQTVFQRKKNIEAHVGGMIVKLEQDPRRGAIIGCTVEILRYFVQSYYNDRWTQVGTVTQAERTVA